ncbi:MAG: hypothetical protein AB7Q17_17025 [Phycisphaerae bacterium]
MKRLTRRLCELIAAWVMPVAAAAGTTVETFDFGSNLGGWSYGTGNGAISPVGGNPGPFWFEPGVDTFAPQPRTLNPAGTPFAGDFRARNVRLVGIDLKTFYVDFSAADRPLALMLVSDGRTPADASDDWAAYTLGADCPEPGEGWRGYDFSIPAGSPALPAGWSTIVFGPNAQPDWNEVITRVSQIRFFYGDPELFFIFQVWDVGLDNPRIVVGPLLGDLNCDGVVNNFDIDPFVLAIVDPAGYRARFPNCDRSAADANTDGRIDNFDIEPFVRLLADR